jgi:hypothetical protein
MLKDFHSNPTLKKATSSLENIGGLIDEGLQALLTSDDEFTFWENSPRGQTYQSRVC